MGYKELSNHIRPIVERRSVVKENRNLFVNIGFEWEQKKYLGKVKDVEKENPFKYIDGEFSLYLSHAVYAHIWVAITRNLNLIRLGSADLKVDERSDSLDDFGKTGEAMIPYFLEAVRFDKILKEHLAISKEGSMLVVRINT